MSQSPIARDILVGSAGLPGTVTLPHASRGLIIFAHGSGSSRLSPRNTRVAEQMNSQGFATLLFDLLNSAEAGDRANVFDIPLLASRVLDAVHWVGRQGDLALLPTGLFGASTGAAAALVAAAAAPHTIRAIVSRGGRPDLAGETLGKVQAPTLLIVGERDNGVLSLNRAAQRQMHCISALTVIPRATHLFEEPGTLNAVVASAADWFLKYLK